MITDNKNEMRATQRTEQNSDNSVARNQNETADADRPTDSTASAQKISAEIKRTWGRLTPEEIAFSEKDQVRFNAALKQKYGLNREETEKRMKEIRSTCALPSKE